MTFESIVQEIPKLTIEQRKQLVLFIVDSLADETVTRSHNILEFEGVGKHLRDIDAQEYINQLRAE